jgi:alpha-glucosidase (family GH31 glycosyl hydrolase)
VNSKINLNTKSIAIKAVLFFSFLISIALVKAQPAKNRFDISLANKSVVRVQVCSPQIFRIRVSVENQFPETLMERYGILKTDWNAPDARLKTEKGKQIITADNYQLMVNPQNGEISVIDAKGKFLINRIKVNDSKTSFCTELANSLNTYFGKPKSSAEIIGSNKGPAENKDQVEVGDVSKSCMIEFSLNSEERLYGGGNTSRSNIQHRGTALRMWATYQKTEIPLPFMMSSSGWGVFDNTTAKNYFDIGRFQKDKLAIYNTDGSVDFYLMLGNSLPDLINQYTTITGKPYLLPKWGYGLAFGGNMMENQFNIMNNAVQFRDGNFPCDIFWLEPQWMSKRYDFSTAKNWNSDKFTAEPYWKVKQYPKYEDPNLFVAKLHGMGFKLALWLCIDHDMSIAEEDHLAQKIGKPQSGKEHWFDHLTNFMDQGIDGFKLDPANTLDDHPNMKYYNGYTDKEMHNLNQILLQKQMEQTFRKHKGIRSFHHYCGGYSGTQHWGVSTSGDNGGGRDALFDQLNLGLSGFVNTSADVLAGVTDNKAGMHLGFFLPWIQVNSWYNLLHPWYMCPEEKETFRYYSQLRNSLFPYIYSAALEGSQTGMPILRAMPLAFPDDRKVDNMIYQYMFGKNLLVGVFSDSIYLPKGNWTNYWTGEKVSGGKTVYCKAPPKRGGPLFIREGAIITYQKPMQYIGELPTDTLIVRVYPEKKSTYTLWEDDGLSYDYEKGMFAKTCFECTDSANETEFTIFATEGTYKGMYQSRTYKLEINSSAKPTQVLVNGSKTENWNYDSGKVVLTISQYNVREKQTINIVKVR